MRTGAFSGRRLQQVRHRAEVTELFGSKHRGRYNSFVDSLPSKNKPSNPVHESILEKVQHEFDVKSGQELRKSRERNLKIVQKLQPPSSISPPPTPKRYDRAICVFTFSFMNKFTFHRKYDDELIANIIKCLNSSYGHKPREELSKEQRLGIVDWSEFDIYAEDILNNYDNIKGRERIISWIKFHIRKRDIRFHYDTWIWDPKPDGRMRQTWRKAVVKQLQEKRILAKQEELDEDDKLEFAV